MVCHGQALRRSLDVTSLRTVVHGPTNLKLGSSLHDRAGEGLLEYAHMVGARHVVYHALDVPRQGADTYGEEQSLARLALAAETLGVTICAENLCPVYPGAPKVNHDPLVVRALVERIGSPALRMLFDLGHANVVADIEGTGVGELLEPALDAIALFHVHDNMGARRRGGGGFALDPLRLDLHLPPGLGTLPWERIAPALHDHAAPLVMEIHPSHRPAAGALRQALRAAVTDEPGADTAELEVVPNALA